MTVEGYPVVPRVTKARILRPYNGFELTYAGAAATTPVSFYEVSEHGSGVAGADGVLVYDELAGQPGYEANLERFIPTPLGSRMTAWIPYCVFYDGEALVETPYVYTFHWRIRGVTETAIGRKKGFHTDLRDGYTVRATQRYALPVSSNTIIVEQTEALLALQQQQNLRRERIQVLGAAADTAYLSILPDTTAGVMQQGILDQTDGMPDAVALSETFLRVDFDAEGDELLIQARRADAFTTGQEVANWTFDGIDSGFSYIYGTNVGGTAHVPPEGMGIYVFTGEAP